MTVNKLPLILLIVFMLIALCSPAVLAAGFGAELQRDVYTLCEGTLLTSSVFLGERGYLRENYVECSPGGPARPEGVYGSKVCNYGGFRSMSALPEGKGRHVICGINGDYYDFSTYAPLGIVITDGILRSSDAGHWAVAFRSDGSAFIAKPSLQMSFTALGETYPLSFFNKARTGSGFALFSEDFSYTTKNTSPGTDIILTVPEDTLIRPNCAFTATVEEIVRSGGAMTLPEGKLVLSVADDSDPWRLGMLETLSEGAEMEFSFVCEDERFDDVTCAVGSLYRLLADGEAEEIPDSSVNPRTAVGVRSDGSFILYTADGRQSGYSEGASPNDVAGRLLQLGCTDAALLDGGGSTALSALYVGDGACAQINSSSGGSPRSVSNYIMLVTDAEASDGAAALLGLRPASALLLTGAETKFTAGCADRASFACPLPEGAALESSAGSIDADGVFRAGTEEREGTVTLSAPGLESVSARVKIIETPDEITVESAGKAVTSLSVSPGSVTRLSARAFYGGLEAVSENRCFEWSCEGVGTVSEDGVFTADDVNCEGSITVKAGEREVSLPVSVKGEPYLRAGFEEGADTFTGGGVNSDMAFVARGYRSLRLDYELASGSQLLAVSERAPKYGYIHMRVLSDGSGNTLLCGDSVCAELDGKGWQAVTLGVPAGKELIFSISGSGSGSIYLDHIVCSPDSEAVTFVAPPEIRISGQTVKVSAARNETLSLTLDGRPLPFTERSGAIYAELPDDGRAHRVSAAVTDIYGNMARGSADIPPAEEQHPFEDMRGHWAERDAAYLFSLGFVSGSGGENARLFMPEEPVTRADFMVLVSRLLGLDTELYSEISLPFADAESIPEHALAHVRAAYALGIISGSLDDGVLNLDPDSPLTRAQAITIAGRLQPRGFAEGSMDFTDSADIPDWAAPYVSALIAQGIVKGHDDGSLKPNDSVTRAQAARIIADMM